MDMLQLVAHLMRFILVKYSNSSFGMNMNFNLKTHIFYFMQTRAHTFIKNAILSCACANMCMRVAMCYQSQTARKCCVDAFRVRVWLGLGLGVESILDGVCVTK